MARHMDLTQATGSDLAYTAGRPVSRSRVQEGDGGAAAFWLIAPGWSVPGTHMVGRRANR
jgi:hypothetical protein